MLHYVMENETGRILGLSSWKLFKKRNLDSLIYICIYINYAFVRTSFKYCILINIRLICLSNCRSQLLLLIRTNCIPDVPLSPFNADTHFSVLLYRFIHNAMSWSSVEASYFAVLFDYRPLEDWCFNHADNDLESP